MYHLNKTVNQAILYLSLMGIALIFAIADTHMGLAAGLPSSFNDNRQVEEANSPLPLMPQGRFYKHKPKQTVIYQHDSTLLGKRTPLLIVHGLRAEYYRDCRWDKVIKHLTANQEFSSKFKIYLARYDSTAGLDKVVPQMREKISELYHFSGQKPIVVLALSMGGNLIYESMLKPETDKQIKLLFTMGTPFHGSPLFCADWSQYGIYKNPSLPLTRIDHSLAYRLYFSRNPNLLYDMRWDNCDQAIPNIGHFASRLPFGPRGNLIADQSVNQELVAANQKNFDKNKLITYSGFLINPYQLPETARVMESTIMFPYTLFTMFFPLYLAGERPVLRMLNRQISTVVTTEPITKRTGTHFVYLLNDGITPVISAMFLADRYCTTESITRETDLAKIRPFIDVRVARGFSQYRPSYFHRWY